ncbi:MAG: glycoside hydrolase 43 family protein, partial [Verrucomicrobiota bacterium]
PAPQLPEFPFKPVPARDDFDGPHLAAGWCSPRRAADESWASLSERPGFLRLRGQESLCSLNRVSLVARRIGSVHFQADTCVEFEPENFQQMAGLVCLYDNINYYYLRVYRSDSLGTKCLGLVSLDNGVRSEHRDCRLPVAGKAAVFLRVIVRGRDMTFYYSLDGTEWLAIGPVFDASKLSDEYCGSGRFTGAFVGITAQDFHLRRSHADFDYFEYSELEDKS